MCAMCLALIPSVDEAILTCVACCSHLLLHSTCIDRLAKQLEECGILFVHKGMSSRCPRLKVKLEFDCAPSVSYDLIFAVVDNDLATLGKLALSSRGEISSSLKPCDSCSKVALTRPNFLQQVIEAINGKMSVGEFGMVVEMAVLILRAFRQKSNAYHCIRIQCFI